MRDQFVAVELSGSADFETATEQRLRNGGVAGSDIPQFQGLGSQNPTDGIVNYKILYQTDPASQTDQVKLYLGADPNDRDGLVMTGQLPGQPLQAPSTGRNVLGMTTVFTPLLAATAPANPADGSVSEIALSAAVLALPIVLAEAGFLNVERVVLYGGELNVTARAGQWVSTLLFDVETAISASISIAGFTILEIPRDKPVAVRYKAIGLRMGYPPGSASRFELRPMFDSSKGYSIDLSGPGAVRVPDPIGQIIQVLGARIARTNPLTFEIDLGFAIDLGVVTIERARVRLPVDPLGPPELTAFAASMNVPGVLEGRGYMEINSTPSFEIKGQIDVSLVPLKLRLAAGIGVADISAAQGGPATGVIITLELELPVAIPLASPVSAFTGSWGSSRCTMPATRAASRPSPRPDLAQGEGPGQPDQHRGLDAAGEPLGLRRRRHPGHHGRRHHLQREGDGAAGAAGAAPAAGGPGEPAGRPAGPEGQECGGHVPLRDRSRLRPRHPDDRHFDRVQDHAHRRNQHPHRGLFQPRQRKRLAPLPWDLRGARPSRAGPCRGRSTP